MSDKRDTQNSPSTAERDMIVAGESWIDESGRLTSGVGKAAVSNSLLQSVLKRDSAAQLKDPIGSYRTTDDMVEDLLNTPSIAPVAHGDVSVQAHGAAEERPFIGVDLHDKITPSDLPEQGKDPMGLRMFIGDEFPRMLAYGKPKLEHGFVTNPETGEREMAVVVAEKAKPAFYSHWPEGTKLEDMKTLKVNIATKLPDYMTKGEVAAVMDARSDFCFNGKSLDDSFTPISDKVEKAWKRFAADYEKTFGIKLDIRRDDAPDAHPVDEINISVCGFAGGNPQLAGFANFPQGITEWGGGLEALGHKQGYMMLNHEYCNSPLIDENAVYDLIEHEFGHFMGMVHPHDLGAMRMSQEEALNNTVMAYTDGKFSRFEGQEGIICGPVDLGLRKYMHNPPKLNTEHGTVYDMEEQYKKSLGENADSRVMARTHLMPSIPIVNNGTGTVLRASTNADIIDTEPGHMSFRQNPLGVRQGYALVEGHIEKILGRAGDNHIFLSSKGAQEVHPGVGNNTIHIYAPNIGDEKEIHSQGKDRLVLHQDVFIANPDLKVEQNGKDVVLKGAGGAIVLKDQLAQGKGISSVAVINDEGRAVMQQDVRHFDAVSFDTDLIQPVKRQIERQLEAEKNQSSNRTVIPAEPNLDEVLPEQVHECDLHDHSPAHHHGNDNARHAAAAPEKTSHVSRHLQRLREQEEKKQEGAGPCL